jgi:hypothetical protein
MRVVSAANKVIAKVDRLRARQLFPYILVSWQIEVAVCFQPVIG